MTLVRMTIEESYGFTNIPVLTCVVEFYVQSFGHTKVGRSRTVPIYSCSVHQERGRWSVPQ